MKMTIAKVSKPIALSMCMSAWLFAGHAHAANSHLYPAIGCLDAYPLESNSRTGGALESDTGGALVTCPIVTEANATQITVTVFYETGLFTDPTYAGKPPLFGCILFGYDPAKKGGPADLENVSAIVRNQHIVEGSLKLSIEATHQFNVLNCNLPATTESLFFRVLGYRVDES
jgi:hypothetical protein